MDPDFVLPKFVASGSRPVRRRSFGGLSLFYSLSCSLDIMSGSSPWSLMRYYVLSSPRLLRLCFDCSVVWALRASGFSW